jgi:hypothetical protein
MVYTLERIAKASRHVRSGRPAFSDDGIFRPFAVHVSPIGTLAIWPGNCAGVIPDCGRHVTTLRKTHPWGIVGSTELRSTVSLELMPFQ